MMDSEQLEQLATRDLYVDDQDGETLRRAIAGKVHELVRNDELLGRIAQARPDSLELPAPSAAGRRRLDDAPTDWSNLQVRSACVAARRRAAGFPPAARCSCRRRCSSRSTATPTTRCCCWCTRATQEYRDYSASHALLVAVVAELASRHVPGITPAQRQSPSCAALSMNVAMTALQNQLAQQSSRSTPQQRAEVDAHPARAVAALRRRGRDDALWLEAVLHHHDAPAGRWPAWSRRSASRASIRRADVFAARMSPRCGRQALSATAAAKAAYLDEQGKPGRGRLGDHQGGGSLPARLAGQAGRWRLPSCSSAAAGALQCTDGGLHNNPGSPCPLALRQTMPTHAVTGVAWRHEVPGAANPQRLADDPTPNVRPELSAFHNNGTRSAARGAAQPPATGSRPGELAHR